MVDVLEDLLLLFRSKDLLDDADWLVLAWAPFWELFLKLIDYCVVDKDLASESVEFSEPGLTDNLSIHGCFESIFSQFCVMLFISKCTDSPLNCEDEITCIVTLKCIATTFL